MSVRDMPLKALVDGLYKAQDSDLAALRRSNEEESVPLILTETEGILKLLLGFVRPSRILEVGTAHGYSAIFFARTCPDARITTIERNPAMIGPAKETFASFREGERIDLRTGDAMEVLRGLTEEIQSSPDEQRFDFVFIDAAKSHYREFLEAAERISTDSAIIVCDNILLKGWIVEADGAAAKRHRTSIKYMKQFLQYLRDREDLEVTILTGGDGLAIIRHR